MNENNIHEKQINVNEKIVNPGVDLDPDLGLVLADQDINEFDVKYVSVNELNQRKRSQLHQSVNNISFYLSIEDFTFSPVLNTYIYRIEYGTKQNSTFSVSIKFIYKRYSEILNFYSKLPSIDKNIDIGDFPKKIWFFKNDKNKIRKRYEQMNECLSKVSSIKGIIDSEIFHSFINSTINHEK